MKEEVNIHSVRANAAVPAPAESFLVIWQVVLQCHAPYRNEWMTVCGHFVLFKPGQSQASDLFTLLPSVLPRSTEKIQSVTLCLLLLDLNWKRSAKRCSAESHTLPMSWGNAVNAEKMWRQNRTLQISQIRYVMIYCLKTKQKNAKLMYWSQRI